jgi:hypothetical protein
MGCIFSPGPTRSRLTSSLAFLLAMVGLTSPAVSAVRAADIETRQFVVMVDGKKAGDYQLAITRQPDGTISTSARSEVKVTVLAIPVYTYSYQGAEVWKNGKLQHFQSSGKEKGKEFAVRADLDGTNLNVQANGEQRRVSPDVWMTSCWQLPAAEYRNSNVMLLGCDTGKEIASRLQYVGSEQLTLAGQATTCSHYKVMKDVAHDLWYDGQERLVRDEWVSSGHKTVIALTGISH